MDVETARKVQTDVISGRKRWGVLYTTGEYSVADLVTALVVLHEAGEIAAGDAHEELVNVKRQLTASKAREAKLKKKIEKLQESST